MTHTPGPIAKFDCGCEAFSGAQNIDIKYCPMHKAAPDMLAALEAIRDLARTGLAPAGFNMDVNEWAQFKLRRISGMAGEALAAGMTPSEQHLAIKEMRENMGKPDNG